MPPPFLKKKNSSKDRGVYPVFLHHDDPTKPVAYINLTIVDASEAVYNMVHAKVQEKQSKLPGPKALKNTVAKSVAKAASNKVPPKAIAENLSKKLPKNLMYKMYQKPGMRLAAQTVFLEDSFFVMQIQVQHVDSMKLLSGAKTTDDSKMSNGNENNSSGNDNVDIRIDTTDVKTKNINNDDKNKNDNDDDDESVTTQVLDEWIEEQSQMMTEQMESAFVTTAEPIKVDNKKKVDLFSCFKGTASIKDVIIALLEWILVKLGGTQFQRALEERHLPALVQSKLSENMKEMLDKKLTSKSLKAETAVLSEVEEARYFFKQLQMVRSRAKTKTNTTTTSSSTA